MTAADPSARPDWATEWVWRDPEHVPRRTPLNRELERVETDWLPGPWDNEPDKVVWRGGPEDPLPRRPRMALRNFAGAWCGYVGLFPGDPGYRAHRGAEPVRSLPAHGGITFAGGCDGPGAFACHTAMADEPDVWWVGFDTSHGWDTPPAHASFLDSRDYRSLDYVRAECEALAQYIDAMGRASRETSHIGDGTT